MGNLILKILPLLILLAAACGTPPADTEMSAREEVQPGAGEPHQTHQYDQKDHVPFGYSSSAGRLFWILHFFLSQSVDSQ